MNIIVIFLAIMVFRPLGQWLIDLYNLHQFNKFVKWQGKFYRKIRGQMSAEERKDFERKYKS